MIKHFCDRCGNEMDRAVIVTMSAEAPITANRIAGDGKTLELCPPCGQDLRVVLNAKITRQRPGQ